MKADEWPTEALERATSQHWDEDTPENRLRRLIMKRLVQKLDDSEECDRRDYGPSTAGKLAQILVVIDNIEAGP